MNIPAEPEVKLKNNKYALIYRLRRLLKDRCYRYYRKTVNFMVNFEMIIFSLRQNVVWIRSITRSFPLGVKLHLSSEKKNIANGSRIVRKYPVLVFIHGESYEWNSGNPYDGRVLASNAELVVVTLNYRLGIL
ncbi:neuroligin-1-like, partial [Aphis craccivora]